MGDITVAAFAALTLAGLALVTWGVLRRARTVLTVGVALLFALVGAWVLGLPGAALGLLALAFLGPRRRMARPAPAERH